MKLLSDNGVSKVFRDGVWIIKHQPKFLTDNEFWCLKALSESGYVPSVQRTGIEELTIRYIAPMPNDLIQMVSIDYLLSHAESMLGVLDSAGIRHGDLTEYAVIISFSDARPYMIDFAESRLACDPRTDKRPEGDRYWLTRTMEKYVSGRVTAHPQPEGREAVGDNLLKGRL